MLQNPSLELLCNKNIADVMQVDDAGCKQAAGQAPAITVAQGVWDPPAKSNDGAQQWGFRPSGLSLSNKGTPGKPLVVSDNSVAAHAA